MLISDRYPIRAKALIYKGELDYISKCVLDYPNIETGGDLFGFWTHSGFPIIQYVIGPGQNSNHQVAFFNQDADYLQRVGNVLRTTHGLQHIGEWHSHHRLGLAEPSSHDITTITKAIDIYSLSKFFLVITNVRGNSSSINGFMFKKEQGRHFDYTGWVVLDGDSPVRGAFDVHHPSLLYKPKTTLPSIVNLSTASLDETKYIKPEYSPEYWLQNKTNQIVLKDIIDGLGDIYQDVKVFQNNTDNTIYLKFFFNNKEYNLSFPQDFPISRPILNVTEREDSVIKEATEAVWTVEDGIAKATINFTKFTLETSNKLYTNI